MTQQTLHLLQGVVVEEQVDLTLEELCRACLAEPAHVTAWVFEGVLEPQGQVPAEWRFCGDSLRRARMAQRLAGDLEINPAGVALVLDLLEEIQQLQARLRRAGVA